MKPYVINGSKIAHRVREEVKNIINRKGYNPLLAVIFVHSGNKSTDNANQLYVNMKTKMAKKLGIQVKNYTYNSHMKQRDILIKIQQLNQDAKVDGILVQLPLPAQINEHDVEAMIAPDKDVDGVNPTNIGKLATNVSKSDRYYPTGATPTGIMKMLDYYIKDTGHNVKEFYNGTKALVIGRSNIVGRPLALMLINRGCETSVVNHFANINGSLTKYIQNADIVISATGSIETVTSDDINGYPILIDAGENVNPDTHKLCGDISSEAKAKSQAYSPVPHGVGPMCVAMVMYNTLKLTELHKG